MDDQKYTILASKDNWIEGEAVEQLKHVAGLPGMVHCFGMPDLHPGKGIPIGVVAMSYDRIYPHLAGNDIGCGMGLWQTDLKRKKVKPDKCVKRLVGLESPWEGDTVQWLQENGLPNDFYDSALGTIGGGNHFAELQAIEKTYDENLFQSLDLDAERLLILVHSGSRGLGESILQSHVGQYGTTGLAVTSQGAQDYLQKHNRAIAWARANRQLIAHRFAEQLNIDHQPILDLCHNSITSVEYEHQTLWLHRKGAAPSDAGPVIVPGTRGTLSYLVQPSGEQDKDGWSLAHGAGRKWNRKSARARLKDRYTVKNLTHTELGGEVICEDKDLLYEEAPQAYKHIDRVIQDMVDAGMISVIATLRPLITYKVRRAHD
jgi:release factor H-coupled RctB family protein